MEAARRLAEREHSVVLFERRRRLAAVLFMQEQTRLKATSGATQMVCPYDKKTEGIELRLGTEATRELVLAEKPTLLSWLQAAGR
jgi:hypothetical protein